MFRNKFLSTVLMSFCMVLCVLFVSSMTIEAADGTLQLGEDGKFYYYEGDEWIKDKHGYVDFDGSKFLVAHGVVATEMNGLVMDPDNESDWYFLSNGLAQTQHTGLVEYDGEWFYVSEGKLDTTINDYVEYDGGLFFVAVGRLVREYQGLAQDPNGDDWYYVADGQAQTQYTGLAEYDGEWFFIETGKFNKEFSGIVDYNGGYFKIADGTMVAQVNGDSLKVVQQRSYDYSFGKLYSSSVTTYNENEIRIKAAHYDEAGELLSEQFYNDEGEYYKSIRYDDENGSYTDYETIYDKENNMEIWVFYSSDGTNNTYHDCYLNEDGNITKRVVRTQYGVVGTSIYEYSEDGIIQKETFTTEGAEHLWWTKEYDENGNMIREEEHQASGVFVTTCKYDDRGNQIEILRTYNGETDYKTEFEYDSENTMTKYIQYSADLKVFYIINYEYNDRGNIVKEEANYTGYDGSTNVTYYSYIYK